MVRGAKRCCAEKERCRRCEKPFVEKGAAIRHVVETHGSRMVRCLTCNKEYDFIGMFNHKGLCDENVWEWVEDKLIDGMGK